MKKNDTRNRIFNRYASTAVRGGVLVCFSAQVALTPLVAFADTGLPPPAVHQTTQNSFPSSQALQRQGYDPSRGVLRVNENNRGGATVTKNGGTITGSQNKTVVVTGNYGEKGTINTNVRQNVNVSRLGTAANAVIVGGAVGNAAQNPTVREFAEKTGNAIKQGDFGGAVHNAIMTGGAALDGLLGGIIRNSVEGFGKGLGTLPNDADGLKGIFNKANANQAKAEQGGDLAGAIGNAAIAKAAGTAAQAQQKQQDYQNIKKQSPNEAIWQLTLLQAAKGKGAVETSLGVYTNKQPSYTPSEAYYDSKGKRTITKSGDFNGYLPASSTSIVRAFVYYKSVNYQTVQPPSVEPQDMTLNGNDIQNILNRMLENQQTNHKELMNQLAKIGNAVEQATTSREWTASSTLSEPYTPKGSTTPQQTRFEIDRDGNVTATTVPRPDLKPNGSQAPTRTEVIRNPNAQQTGQQQPGQQQGTQQQPGQQQGTQQQPGQQQGTQQQPGQQQGTQQQPGQQQGTQQQPGQQQGTQQQPGQQQGTQQQPGQQQGTQQQTQQQQQKQEFCQQNPNSAQCADLGEADYEDIEIPENAIDLKLEPMDIFSTDGTCPANPSFSLGALGTFEIPYDYFCNIARLLRPILILGTIIMCGFFAYNAVKEL